MQCNLVDNRSVLSQTKRVGINLIFCVSHSQQMGAEITPTRRYACYHMYYAYNLLPWLRAKYNSAL